MFGLPKICQLIEIAVMLGVVLSSVILLNVNVLLRLGALHTTAVN
jgi:hypothetical protein